MQNYAILFLINTLFLKFSLIFFLDFLFNFVIVIVRVKL